MTVGEKIQYYRKKTGLSQEELGQKMFVSRQTISLWEMDKTLPTVDNLIRLKEIFSVSVDDILSETEPNEVEEAKPTDETDVKTDLKEVYTLEYTKEDMRSIFKWAFRPLIYRFIIVTVVLAVLLVFMITTDAPDALVGILIGGILVNVGVYARTFVIGIKTNRANEKRSLGNTCQYEVCDTYFTTNVIKDGEIIKSTKVYFNEIEKISVIGKLWLIQHRGQSYVFNKDEVSADSPLRTFVDKRHVKVEMNAKKSPLERAATVLFFLSIASIFGSLIAMAILTEINHFFIGNTWVLFLFTPISIASIVVGIILKKKGKKYKKNIVVGIIITVILCIYGSFTFIFAGLYTHDDAPVLRVERLLHIDIPEYEQINTMDWTKGTQSTSRGYIYWTSDVYFKEEAVEEFEQRLSYDYKWIDVIPNELVGITSAFCDNRNYDYFLIYNVDTGEFNSLPSSSGKFRFINVMYNCKSNAMMIVEYEIAYVKQGNAASVPFLLFLRSCPRQMRRQFC